MLGYTPTFLKPSHSSYLPAYEDGTECSETSAYKIQTPGNYPEESIQVSYYLFFLYFWYSNTDISTILSDSFHTTYVNMQPTAETWSLNSGRMNREPQEMRNVNVCFVWVQNRAKCWRLDVLRVAQTARKTYSSFLNLTWAEKREKKIPFSYKHCEQSFFAHSQMNSREPTCDVSS